MSRRGRACFRGMEMARNRNHIEVEDSLHALSVLEMAAIDNANRRALEMGASIWLRRELSKKSNVRKKKSGIYRLISKMPKSMKSKEITERMGYGKYGVKRDRGNRFLRCEW